MTSHALIPAINPDPFGRPPGEAHQVAAVQPIMQLCDLEPDMVRWNEYRAWLAKERWRGDGKEEKGK